MAVGSAPPFEGPSSRQPAPALFWAQGLLKPLSPVFAVCLQVSRDLHPSVWLYMSFQGHPLQLAQDPSLKARSQQQP